jgi:hypothetical protein
MSTTVPLRALSLSSRQSCTLVCRLWAAIAYPRVCKCIKLSESALLEDAPRRGTILRCSSPSQPLAFFFPAASRCQRAVLRTRYGTSRATGSYFVFRGGWCSLTSDMWCIIQLVFNCNATFILVDTNVSKLHTIIPKKSLFYGLKEFHASFNAPNTPLAIIRCSKVVFRTFNCHRTS